MNHPELIDAFDKIARVVERDDSRFQYIDKELDTLRQILSQHQNTIDGLVSLLEAKNSFDRAALVRLSQVQRSQPNSNTSVEEPLRLQQVSPPVSEVYEYDASTPIGTVSVTKDAASSSSIQNQSTKSKQVKIKFLESPGSVREIYDEFKKGFNGQPPLGELDRLYGASAWRGDSKTKESRKYQRRQKICVAIDRSVIRLGKSVDEVISYLEEFRGLNSLSWLMNGNFPLELK